MLRQLLFESDDFIWEIIFDDDDGMWMMNVFMANMVCKSSNKVI